MPARDACGVSRGRSSTAVSSVRRIKLLLLFSHCSESDITAEVTAVAKRGLAIALSFRAPAHPGIFRPPTAPTLSNHAHTPDRDPRILRLHVATGNLVAQAHVGRITALKQSPAPRPLLPAACRLLPALYSGGPPPLSCAQTANRGGVDSLITCRPVIP